jgi:pimeloyl-ACP methyl ester carboxylesterase
MMTEKPRWREAGAGPAVICLHANASSSVQWRALMDDLAPHYHLFAVDSYGAGGSPAWSEDRQLTLNDEVALLEPVFERAAQPVLLVGHSYGAAVALMATLGRPGQVRALALYEPTLFSLVDAHTPPPNEADGIRHVAAQAGEALAAGNRDAAAACFIDYWMGNTVWAAMPEKRREPIRAAIVNIREWAHALFGERTPLAAFGSLNLPVLLMTGTASPASSRAVARLLTGVLPQATVVEFAGLGHMAPLTHPQVVNAAIADFLDRQSPGGAA